MKIKFKASNNAPDFYVIEENTITAHVGDKALSYDFADFPGSGIFRGAREVNGISPIRGVDRTESGELVISLVQRVIAGQYTGATWDVAWRGPETIIDAADYDPNTCYVVPTGMAGVDDYEIVQGVDVAGNTGWTVRKKETADG